MSNNEYHFITRRRFDATVDEVDEIFAAIHRWAMATGLGYLASR